MSFSLAYRSSTFNDWLLRTKHIDSGKVRFVLREFPLDRITAGESGIQVGQSGRRAELPQ